MFSFSLSDSCLEKTSLERKWVDSTHTFFFRILEAAIHLDETNLSISHAIILCLLCALNCICTNCWCILVIWYQIPVTYAGGVTTMADLERIKLAGSGHVDVTVGSALDIFGGNLAYKDVVLWHSKQEALTV